MSASEQPIVHTPGPWTMKRYTGHEPQHNDWPGVIEGSDGTNIYNGPFSFRSLQGNSPEEAEANAKLIAAAPDLLEACVAFLAAYKTCDGDMRTAAQMAAVAVDKVV